MPYLTCVWCGIRVYSAARIATRDPCPRCGVDLQPATSAAAAGVRGADSESSHATGLREEGGGDRRGGREVAG
jgi:hypothetical protein